MLTPLLEFAPMPFSPAAPAGRWPILDRRPHLPWRRRLPSRLSTAGLWLGSVTLIGPAKLAGLLLVPSLLMPAVLLLDQTRRQAQRQQAQLPLAAPAVAMPPAMLPLSAQPRALVAAQLGVSEAQLFRARHASRCTVHHDSTGQIVALVVPCPPLGRSVPSPDAHPVG